MATYFTSDPHLFHEKVALLRGVEDADTWTQHWFDVYRQTVSQSDTIWILGDMTGGGKIPPMLELMAQLPGRKILIAGNHDPVHPTHRDYVKYMKPYHEVFAAVAPFARRKFDGREFMLSHFPYHGDHTETERYSSCRLRDIGLPLVHGHTHSPFKMQESYR